MTTTKNENSLDFNKIIPLSFRKKLNQQKNQLQINETVHKNERTIDVYRYIIGLGEKHFRSFSSEIDDLYSKYPWIKKKHVKFIMNELIINTQFSMLREIVEKVPKEEKVPAFFYLTVFVNEIFFSAGIEEYGDFFDYTAYLETKPDGIGYLFDDDIPDMKVEKNLITNLDDLSKNKLKLALTPADELIIPDASNKIALQLIENATDHDFYISTFYKNGTYKWKRIYFRVENF